MEKCRVPELKDLLRKARLKVSGRKADLIERLADGGIRTAPCAGAGGAVSKTSSSGSKTSSKKTSSGSSSSSSSSSTGTMSPTQLAKLTVVQLKDLLRKAKLPVSGRKAELIARLTGGGPAPAPAPAPAPRPRPTPTPTPTPAPKKKDNLTETQIKSITVNRLKQMLRHAGADNKGRKAELVARAVRVGISKATYKAVVGYEWGHFFSGGALMLSSHDNPEDALAAVKAGKDRVWRDLYLKLHSDYTHPPTAHTKLDRADLEPTPELNARGRRVDVRQPFPIDFAKKMSLTDIRTFINSYFGDVLADAVTSSFVLLKFCGLMTLLPKYLTQRYHLGHGFALPHFDEEVKLDKRYDNMRVTPGIRKLAAAEKSFMVRVFALGYHGDVHSSHANYLFISPKDKRAYLFEPHGRKYDSFHKDLDTLLKRELGIQLAGLVPGSRQVQGRNLLCASWSYYYAMMRLVNPDVDGAAITRAMTHRNLARFFAWVTFDVPQQEPCKLARSYRGWGTTKGEPLGYDAVTRTTGTAVKEVLASKYPRFKSRYGHHFI